MEWLDKIIEDQKEQRELMDKVCNPFTPAELRRT